LLTRHTVQLGVVVEISDKLVDSQGHLAKLCFTLFDLLARFREFLNGVCRGVSFGRGAKLVAAEIRLELVDADVFDTAVDYFAALGTQRP